jgi:hypothetical protein
MPDTPKGSKMSTMDASKVEAEVGKIIAEAGKLLAETSKLTAEQAKLNAEARKLAREASWYPGLVIASVIGATVAATKLFL